jgi:hypothetical protein
MQIKILGTESLGVRGLSCLVESGDRVIVIDPGMALGYHRYGLLPHPAQVAVGERIREEILAALQRATDVVFSHYHGDHVPLAKPNPYQVDLKAAGPLIQDARIWAKGLKGLNPQMETRRSALAETLGAVLPEVERWSEGILAFSPSLPHGEPNSKLGTVMMTRVESESQVFVHASDIQLLDEEPVSLILDWEPDVVLAGGPPLYLDFMGKELREKAWKGALRLAEGVETLILDHHLLRSMEGLGWIEELSLAVGKRVYCAADFMSLPRRLLEAQREALYAEMPVPKGWHAAYAEGRATTEGYKPEDHRGLFPDKQ